MSVSRVGREGLLGELGGDEELLGLIEALAGSFGLAGMIQDDLIEEEPESKDNRSLEEILTNIRNLPTR